MKTKSNLRILFLATVVFSAFGMNANAQVNDAHTRIEENGQTFTCSFIVELSDTVSTDEIEVSLGSMPDSNDVSVKNFLFDSANVPSGCSYERNGTQLLLGIGTLADHSTYYAAVRIKNGGTWSNKYQFITN